MATPSVPNTFVNGTTADADDVNANFSAIINSLTDGNDALTIDTLTANGAAVFNGTVTLGNATGDDVTITGYVASDIIPKTNAAYDLGTSALCFEALYLDDDATNGGTIYFDAGSTEFIRSNAAGTDLIVDGFTTVTIDATLQPESDATSPIGTTSLGWTSLYLDNGATDGGAVFFDGSNTSFLKSDSSGADLDVGGFTGLDLKAAEIKRFSLYDEAKSADYTITDDDGVSIVHMTTSSTDRTVTLPTASANAGRVITVKKVDSGTGSVTLDGEGSETIDGATTIILHNQFESVSIQCDGSSWHITDSHLLPSGEVKATSANGHGSTNTKIRRFTTTDIDTGTSITYADSTTLGTTFTINQKGIYTISYADKDASAAAQMGVSKNSSQLTTNIASITTADRLAFFNTPAANIVGQGAITARLAVGDVIRAHDAGVLDSTSTVENWFHIVQVARLLV